jgi:hypothetical protein
MKVTWGYQHLVPIAWGKDRKVLDWQIQVAKQKCISGAEEDGNKILSNPTYQMTRLWWVENWHNDGSGEYVSKDLAEHLGVDLTTAPSMYAIRVSVVCEMPLVRKGPK